MRVLVLRFSSIGDVSLVLPAVKEVLDLNDKVEITVISKPFFKPLFEHVPGLSFFGVELTRYPGIYRLLVLSKELYRATRPQVYIDLHNSIRSNVIGFYMRLNGVKCWRLDKGRREKKELTRRLNKNLHPLKHAVTRYLDVFARAGFTVPDNEIMSGGVDSGIQHANCLAPLNDKGKYAAIQFNHLMPPKFIGLAPFAGLPLKELPYNKVLGVIAGMLKVYDRLELILFASQEDQVRLQELITLTENEQIPQTGQHLSIATLLAPEFSGQLSLISGLDLMISMDSANLHLASLLGVRVLGIYGTTHPYLGFAPYGQEVSGTFGHEGLDCRPCTVYGKGTCYRGDFACMNDIPVSSILQKIDVQLTAAV